MKLIEIKKTLLAIVAIIIFQTTILAQDPNLT